MKKSMDERFQELWEDEDIFEDFVNWFLEKHEDVVKDIIADHLAAEVSELGTIRDLYTDYVNAELEREAGTRADEAYMRMKDEGRI